MSVAEAGVLLAEMTALGIEVVADGHRVHFRPRSSVPSALLQKIRELKADLIALLAASPEPQAAPERAGGPLLPPLVRDWPEPWREDYEERAAIMEFEGGLSRQQADLRARAIVAARFALERGEVRHA